MIYHCNACKFNFSRYGEVTACPDCGKQNIRYATAGERAEFLMYQDMIDQELAQQERMRPGSSGAA